MANDPNYAAVIETAKARITTSIRPTPTPGPNELVVRNYAIAVNPVDWKLQDAIFKINKYPIVLGSDVSGVVTTVGEGVSKFKVGDRVIGFAGVIYNQNVDHGAWQTYTVLRELATTKLPDAVSFEDGSVFPMAVATAGAVLFRDLKIPTSPQAYDPKSSAILIWGGSSSVGSMTIQLAKLWGLSIFATASSQHHEWVKGLGATEVFDHKDPDIVKKLIAAAKSANKVIDLAFDTISSDQTSLATAQILQQSGGKGSKLVLSLPWPAEREQPPDLQISQPIAASVFYEEPKLGAWLFNDWLTTALEKQSIVPAPKIQIVEGGIQSAQQAFDLSKAGVSGRKLVVKLD